MDEQRFVRLLRIARITLVAVLIYTGFGVATSRLQFRVLHPRAARGEQDSAAEQTAQPKTRDPCDYSIIVQNNLFGGHEDTEVRAPSAERPGHAEAPALPQQLGLRLIGAIAGAPAATRAILQDTRNNTTGSYRIGDTVASATVEAIARDAVVLRYQGRLLVLKLRADTAPAPLSNNSGLNDNRAPGQDTASGRADDADLQTVPPGRAGYLGEFLRQVTIEPYVTNNHTEGLKITGLEKIPMAQMFGLKNGDIVESINGQQLTSRQKAFQVLMKARAQPRIDIRLLRDGKNKDLSFNP